MQDLVIPCEDPTARGREAEALGPTKLVGTALCRHELKGQVGIRLLHEQLANGTVLLADSTAILKADAPSLEDTQKVPQLHGREVHLPLGRPVGAQRACTHRTIEGVGTAVAHRTHHAARNLPALPREGLLNMRERKPAPVAHKRTRLNGRHEVRYGLDHVASLRADKPKAHPEARLVRNRRLQAHRMRMLLGGRLPSGRL